MCLSLDVVDKCFDDMGVIAVLSMMQDVCERRSKKLTEEYGDKKAGKPWRDMAVVMERAQDAIERISERVQ